MKTFKKNANHKFFLFTYMGKGKIDFIDIEI